MGTSLMSCEYDSGKKQKIEKVILMHSVINEEVLVEGNLVVGIIIQEHPRFKEVKGFTREESKTHFDKEISRFIKSRLDIWQQHLDLKPGQYRVIIKFEIDTIGNVNTIKVRSPHAVIKKEIKKVLKEFPQLIPATQRGKPINTTYILPIKFVID